MYYMGTYFLLTHLFHYVDVSHAMCRSSMMHVGGLFLGLVRQWYFTVGGHVPFYFDCSSTHPCGRVDSTPPATKAKCSCLILRYAPAGH